MNISSDLGQNLRNIRKSKGWSLKELSEKTGGVVSFQTISAIELGKQVTAREATLKLLKEALGIESKFKIGLFVSPLPSVIEWLRQKKRKTEAKYMFIEKEADEISQLSDVQAMFRDKEIDIALVKEGKAFESFRFLCPICYLSSEMIFVGLTNRMDQLKEESACKNFFLELYDSIQVAKLESKNEEKMLFTPDWALF